MSDEILNDDQLDTVAGGVTNITITAKKANTAYATTVRSDKIAPATPAAPKTIDRTASTQALGSLRAATSSTRSTGGNSI